MAPSRVKRFRGQSDTISILGYAGVDRLIRHLHQHKVPIAVATSSHRRHFDVKTQQHHQLFGLFDVIVTGDQVCWARRRTLCCAVGVSVLRRHVLGRAAAVIDAAARWHACCSAGVNTLLLSSVRRVVPVVCASVGPKAIAPPFVCVHPQVGKGKPDPEIFQTAAAAFPQPPASPDAVLVFEDAPSGIQSGVAAGMHVILVPDPNLSKDLIPGLGAAAVLGSLEQFEPQQWGLPAFACLN